MKKIFNFNFTPGEEIKIKLSGVKGQISQVILNLNFEKIYLVKWWNSLDLKSDWFKEKELEKINKTIDKIGIGINKDK